uniref:Retrovirus-related Pol polyprotein from transposon 17.6 n=1 Tax=Cajanus cajan TaxID=3821 RepID=A0A151S433_CAJCA|nr:Retrovirus-related Pol polyprotein from transposon 17.6 [Cajanus cajan]
MLDWPIPKDIKALRGFLGLTGYYRGFVRDYGKITRTLTQLLKKDEFQWNVEAQAALDKLKHLVAELPVLTVPNFSKTFIIETDASNKGLGAVLLQEGRLVAFLNQTLPNRAQNDTNILSISLFWLKPKYSLNCLFKQST